MNGNGLDGYRVDIRTDSYRRGRGRIYDLMLLECA